MGGIFALVIEIVGEYGGVAPFDGDVVSVHDLTTTNRLEYATASLAVDTFNWLL